MTTELTQSLQSKVALYKRIITECAATNVLRPEYLLYLIQEIYYNEEIHEILEQWLHTLTPDPYGRIYWELWHVNSDTTFEVYRDKYLVPAVQCGHHAARAQQIYSDDTINTEEKISKLETQIANGNTAAYIMIHDLLDPDHNGSVHALRYLNAGIAVGDVDCHIGHDSKYPIGTSIWSIDVYAQLCKWGCHVNEHDITHIQEIQNYVSAHRSEFTTSVVHLQSLGVPCTYGLQVMLYTVQQVDNLQKYVDAQCAAAMGGCDDCVNNIASHKHLRIIYEQYCALQHRNRELLQLRALRSCNLNDTVQFVIGGYLEN